MRLIRNLWQIVGILAFWLLWPVLFFNLKRGERARVLVVANGSVLVVKNWLGNGKWGLPGGGVSKGEMPADAALRELKEELTLSLKSEQIELLATGVCNISGLRFNCHYYKANLDWQAPLTPTFPEIFCNAWVNPQSLSSRNAGSDVLTALRAWSA